MQNPVRLPRKTTSGRQFFALLTWNVLRATTACTFSTAQRPKVVRTWCALHILTSKCASRHNGVQFSSLIWPHGSAPAALASLLFDPPKPPNHWIKTVNRDFSAFSHDCIFFLLTLSCFFDLLSSALPFSNSSHLCFSICPYCRKSVSICICII